MPKGKKKNRKRYPKRTILRRRHPSKLGADTTLYRLPLATAPIRRKLKVVMKYQTTAILNPTTAGGTAVVVFRANSLFDPEAGLGGHQPRGFDQLMTLYDHYTVISASIRADFHNSDTSQGQVVGIATRDDLTTSLNMNDYLEGSQCRYGIVSDATAGQNLKSISQTVNPAYFLGRSHPLSDPDMKGTILADPIEQVFFHVFVAPIDQSVDASPVQVNVQLSYIAMLTEPVVPGQS